MKHYISISQGGIIMPTKSIPRLRTLIRKRVCKEGTYTCITPSGTIHRITFETKVHSGVGYGKKPSGKSKTKKRGQWGTYNVLQTKLVKSND